MNIFYEESGRFKTAAVVQKTEAAYQAETLHGKRAKIKAANVFAEFDGDPAAFLAAAEAEAGQIDTALLWEVSGREEFTAADTAAEYYGHPPSKTELAATLIALYAAPMYFYKKGKGVFKAAPEDTLKQALAAVERKKQQDAQIEDWTGRLKNGELPAEVAAVLKTVLHAPDKQSPAYKAFTKAADALKLTPYELARHVGGIASLPQYLRDGFELRQYPQGTQPSDTAEPDIPALPAAEGIRAFSIDDASTTEVDDALSLQELPDGTKRIGIHIAAPALAAPADSSIERSVFQRQSTAYFPGGKITMLPDNWIAAFSLDAGKTPPAVSLYFDVDADFRVSNPVCKTERVAIAENLRIQHIEPHFNRDRGTEGGNAFPHHNDLAWFYRLAAELQKQRGKYEADPPVQYDYGIDLLADGSVAVTQRERNSPIDTLVSEMMILANSTWAQMLEEAGLPGLFRVQPPSSKVRMSTRAEAHAGIGVSHYGWFTSPLRRAADWVNQKQLLSLIGGTEPRFAKNDPALFAQLRDFETAYAACQDFQREMEHYWSLVWLQQHHAAETEAVILKEDLVRLSGLPLAARVTGLPVDLPPRTTVRLRITGLDSEKRFIGLNYLNAVV
ncbi:Exoribonuclease 2 [Kingella potus]|uniref:Exoribonuclease 2 n=1 Tax=Kingella potus TaxID=265175 RepID=A0A377R4H7_9NEIS|nr:RNB domain-containing ribonuclease [Kingella potus]STR02882.1 Exoribonuclease 2 [Kingella potus]